MATVALKTLAVGDTVKIKEKGTSMDYIVVHKGNPGTDRYDSSCNGIWLMRKVVFSTLFVWSSSNVNNYSTSDICTSVNDTFLARYSSDVQNLIKQVKIPYNYGTSDSSGTYLVCGQGVGVSTKVFLLSAQEAASYSSGDGYALDYFTDNTARIGYLSSGGSTTWATRSAYGSASSYYGKAVLIVYSDGTSRYINNASSEFYVRPAMILPGNAAVVGGVITGATVDTPSGLYVGVNGVARNVTNAYVGVYSGATSKARKIVKGYIGVNGVARLFMDNS